MARNSAKQEPTDSNVLATLRGVLPNLSPSEARVARAAIDDPAGTAASTINELATRCETSETTVIRLCRTIGFSGYPAFRLALAAAAASMGDEPEYLSGEILPDDTTAQVIRKVTGTDAQAIVETADQMSKELIEQAARAIGAAERINLFGVGASSFVAQDLQFKLLRIGLSCQTFADPHLALSSAALLGRGDVALGLSHTGTTPDTIRYLAVAAESGATTIAVTNHPRAAITQSAQITLTTAARETTFRSGAMASRIAQLTLVDVLFVLVAQQRIDAARDALQRTYDAVRTPVRAKRT